MTVTATVTSNDSIAGLSMQGLTTRSASAQIGFSDDLAVAKVGALTTRTSDTAGTLTMAAGHGFTDGQIITIYSATSVTYGCTIGTVSSNSVPFTTGAGDVLPADETAITAQVETTQNVDFDGDLLQLICAMATRRGHIRFIDSGSAVLAASELIASEPWRWVADQGVTNPLTGNAVDTVVISNGDSSNTSTIKMGALFESQV